MTSHISKLSPLRTVAHEILAGYGIADKCAFAGVYEFLKRVSYYKVGSLKGTYPQSYS